jgi:hypothetical protein
MIVYNITLHIDKKILDEALIYLKKIYIPEITAGGILVQPSLRRVMHTADEGESYAVQFHAADTDVLKDWMCRKGEAIHRALATRFGEKITGFTTLLEEIDCTE